MIKKYTISLFIACAALCNLRAQTFPAGFSQTLVTGGIVKPTSMAFTPDGRIFVTSQFGDCRVVQGGVLLPTPFTTVSVNTSGERGLLGIAIDPNFAVNNFVYLYYTLPSASNNRVSRFTANGNVAVAGSELVLLELDPLSTNDIHNGGCLKFGPDGKLYIAVGENGNSAHSQNIDSYLGKVLRINSDGTVPSGNPYTSGSAQRQKLWSFGLRNPFTIDFQPGTGKLYINDVGQSTWEEINEGTGSNLNFGWPTVEGVSGNPSYTDPVYAYGHGTSNFLGCAITGGCFFSPSTTNYPASYSGKYFFLDYCSKWINYISTSGATNVTNFATGLFNAPVSITTGTDGNLYYLSYAGTGGGSVYKIVYSASAAPLITQQPQPVTVNAGQPANFTVVASGTAPLSYQWRKNGSNISGATNSSFSIASTVAGDAGQYSVVVTNGSGTTTSNNAQLTVNAPNNLPSATISAPTNGTSYSAGQVINFSGSATDTEDGTLPASAFAWEVIFYHDTHNHPGPSVAQGVTSGSFIIPNNGETSANVFYRIYCYVTDSQGGKDTAYAELTPLVSNITIATNPAGLQVTIEGQPQSSPYTTSSVEGMQRTVGVPSPQTVSSVVYTFANWTDGGANPKIIFTPVNNTTYTANFTCSTPAPSSITSDATNNTICSGNSVTLTRNGGALAIGGSYKWYSSSCGGTLVGTGNSITVSPAVTTTYYVRGEASCGNSSCVSLTITVGGLTAAVTPSGTVSFCAGSAITLSANTGGGITYQWYKNGVAQAGATSSSYLIGNAGTYYIVENSTCGTATSNSVVVNQINNPNPTVTFTTPTTFCSPGNILFTANTFAGVTYQWQKNSVDIAGATAQTYTATTSGKYRVKETANGCTKQNSDVQVSTATSVAAVISANGPTTFCSGGSVVLSVNNAIPGYSYQWKNNGSNIGGATATSYTATSAGSYTCTVSASCGSATSNAIVVSTGGITALVNPSGAINICNGATVFFSANTGSGYAYQWKRNGTNISGATNSTLNATTAGSYTVAITSPCGNATSAATTVNIVALTANITPTGTTTICNGSAATFTANTGYNYTYQWYHAGLAITGATASTHANSTAGNYTVVITQGGVCSAASNIATLSVTNNPNPSVTAGGPTTFCVGQSVTLTANTFAGVTYQWTKNGTNITGATNQSYTATTAGQYSVKETANGCTKQLGVPIVVTVNCREEGLSGEGKGNSEVKVSPNPTNGKLKLEVGSMKSERVGVRVYDVLGKEVFGTQFNNTEETNVHEMDLSSLKSGVYFMQVATSTEKKTLKIIKQ